MTATEMRKIHNLKTWPEYFQAVFKGEKTFELRKNDRDFKVGDLLLLQEFEPSTEFYTGAELVREITYVLDAEEGFLLPGHVALGIQPYRGEK